MPQGSQQVNSQMISTMQDFYNTQYNAQASANNANAAGASAAQGAAISAGVGAVATIGSAVAIF